MTQSKRSLSPSYFKDFTLRQAEEEIVGACIDHEHAMASSLRILSVDDFRSEVADDLRLIYYTLAGWYERGAYDPATNRERLLDLAEPHDGNNRDLPAWEGCLDQLWCPWGTSEEYVETLCHVVTRYKRLADDTIEAIRQWNQDSILTRSGQVPPSPVAPRLGPPKGGGIVRGLDL